MSSKCPRLCVSLLHTALTPLLHGHARSKLSSALLNTTSLESSGQCDGFPTFRQPFILNNRVEQVKDDGTVVLKSPPGTFPTVFGRTSDGEEFAYDPHLALYENSLDSPVSHDDLSHAPHNLLTTYVNVPL